jgi:tripartite-type tricarboxylate transporter receptor subunit TctC
VGIDAVAKAAPDGYTLGLAPVGALAITRHMVEKLPYDIERDLQPVGMLGISHMLLAVSPKLPVASVAEPGNVQLMFESTNSMSPHVKAGRVRALAVSGAKRAAAFPDLPTVAEAGVPGFDVNAWSGVIAPAGLPRPILDKLNGAVNASVQDREMQERLAFLGTEPGGGTPEQFAELIRRDSARWAEVIRRSGAKIE